MKNQKNQKKSKDDNYKKNVVYLQTNFEGTKTRMWRNW